MGWLLLLLAGLSFGWAIWLRKRTGLPWRRIVYQDTGRQRNDQVLVAQQYGLVGKPDYLLRGRRSLIPVEVKPERRAASPYQSDLMQLAAYCLLVEATTGQPPQYGLLRYATQSFKLPYTQKVRREILDLLHSIEVARQAAEVGRSHRQPGRCRGCGFGDICTESLA